MAKATSTIATPIAEAYLRAIEKAVGRLDEQEVVVVARFLRSVGPYLAPQAACDPVGLAFGRAECPVVSHDPTLSEMQEFLLGRPYAAEADAFDVAQAIYWFANGLAWRPMVQPLQRDVLPRIYARGL